MAKAIYIGVSAVAREVIRAYTGVSGVARMIKYGYIGISSVARQFFGYDKYLYNKGDDCSNVHGGFASYARTGFVWQRDEGDWTAKPTLTLGTSTMTVTGMTSHYGSVITKNKINLTNYSKARIIVTATNGVNSIIGFADTNVSGWGDNPCPYVYTTSTGTKTIDLSDITGSYYLAITTQGNASVTVSQIYLE